MELTNYPGSYTHAIYKIRATEKKMILQYCFDSSECFHHI